MIYHPIRYINNGEPLNEDTLNRFAEDTQSNLHQIISELENLKSSLYGTVEETPHKLALRDQYGTTQFGAPRIEQNPLRLVDSSENAIGGKVVKRDSNGTAKFSKPIAGEHPMRLMDMAPYITSSDFPKYISYFFDDLASHPSAKDFELSKGWFRFPNGIIFQWGDVGFGETGTSGEIRWPIPFPRHCMFATVEDYAGLGQWTDNSRVRIQRPSRVGTFFMGQETTNFIPRNPAKFAWMAIGL